MSETGAFGFDIALERLEELIRPGLIGDYSHFEVTELIGFPDKLAAPCNLYTLIVGQEGPMVAPPASKKKFLMPKLHALRLLKPWRIGLVRYALSLAELLTALRSYAGSGQWAPSGDVLAVGPLAPLIGRFAPADQAEPQPWNGILKQNFWSGSHLIELVDPDKLLVAPLLDRPAALQEISDAIRPYVPVAIATASDRLGDVMIQLPVTALVAALGVRPTGGRLDIAWHPTATPRPLRLFYDRPFDGMHVGQLLQPVSNPTTYFPVVETCGGVKASLWDEDHGILLWSCASMQQISQVIGTIAAIHPERRRFFVGQDDDRVEYLVTVSQADAPFTVGQPAGGAREAWSQKRIYREERERLAARREFVQYARHAAGPGAERARALGDLRDLIRLHGRKAIWLWDPYLSADDLLQTLFHAPYAGADLRALSDAQSPPVPRPEPPKLWDRLWRCLARRPVRRGPSFADMQRAHLEANAGNGIGLKLEYRARIGSLGWSFHDRFLIFPETDQGPLAWSLGTSVNALGQKHHILQRVGDARLVADAFAELWEALDQPAQLIWKVP